MVHGETGMKRIQAGIVALVFAGLSCAGQARSQSDHTANLIEGAKIERRVVWYTSLNLTESQILFDAFQKKYPYVQPETFRATAETMLSRILTETRAGRWEFDAVGISQVGTLAHYKVLSPYVSPEAGAYIAEFKDPAGYWTGYSSNYYTLGYNTKMVSPNEAPRRWEDILDAKWKGKISMDREQYAWYAALLEAWGKEKTHRFMVALARQNVQWRRGAVLVAQLMAAGEFPIGVVYVHRIEEMKKNGAPVEWAHTLDPIVVGINGIALSVKPKNPFAARLFIDFLLSKDGQEVIRARGRIPARSDVEPLSPDMSISKLKLKAVPSDIGLRSDDIKDFRRIFGL